MVGGAQQLTADQQEQLKEQIAVSHNSFVCVCRNAVRISGFPVTSNSKSLFHSQSVYLFEGMQELFLGGKDVVILHTRTVLGERNLKVQN